jgi:hypothetical protein
MVQKPGFKWQIFSQQYVSGFHFSGKWPDEFWTSWSLNVQSVFLWLAEMGLPSETAFYDKNGILRLNFILYCYAKQEAELFYRCFPKKNELRKTRLRVWLNLKIFKCRSIETGPLVGCSVWQNSEQAAVAIDMGTPWIRTSRTSCRAWEWQEGRKTQEVTGESHQ